MEALGRRRIHAATERRNRTMVPDTFSEVRLRLVVQPTRQLRNHPLHYDLKDLYNGRPKGLSWTLS
jgi:hypothetical protein